jgi:hypothetical protein
MNFVIPTDNVPRSPHAIIFRLQGTNYAFVFSILGLIAHTNTPLSSLHHFVFETVSAVNCYVIRFIVHIIISSVLTQVRNQWPLRVFALILVETHLLKLSQLLTRPWEHISLSDNQEISQLLRKWNVHYYGSKARHWNLPSSIWNLSRSLSLYDTF